MTQLPQKITIEFIEHASQRYQTLGDYLFYPNGELVIKVSKMGDRKMELCVAIHEFVEAILTQDRGIEEPEIMAFDVQYEKERLEGKHADWEEPGFAPDAPYKKEHFIADIIERILGAELKVDWDEYDKKIMSL